jgi:polar amino acid transport system substrate-binding protein
VRLLDDPFMEIRQAVGTTRSRAPETVRFLRAFVEELKAGGFIEAALRRAQQTDVKVAPAEEPRRLPVSPVAQRA